MKRFTEQNIGLRPSFLRPSGQGAQRIEFLDGLRGVAILLVVIFHAYARWPEIVPFGGQFSSLALFDIGRLGVYLFFIISGFVIFMTLEKCRDFPDFMLRRWFRLFPAMLVCSIFVYATASAFYERPIGLPHFRDLLPGLTFIEPSWWTVVIGTHQGVLEGAFWSLFVEVKFYVLAGALYYLVGGDRTILVLLGLFLIYCALHGLAKLSPTMDVQIMQSVLDQSGARYFGWFGAGALYYRYFHERKFVLLSAAVITALVSALAMYGLWWQPELFSILLISLFTSSILSQKVRGILCHKVLLFFGLVSYPLYLLHENMMVAMIVKMGHFAPNMPSILIPALPILVVVLLGWLVAVYVEPWMKERIRPTYHWMRFTVGMRQAER